MVVGSGASDWLGEWVLDYFIELGDGLLLLCGVVGFGLLDSESEFCFCFIDG